MGAKGNNLVTVTILPDLSSQALSLQLHCFTTEPPLLGRRSCLPTSRLLQSRFTLKKGKENFKGKSFLTPGIPQRVSTVGWMMLLLTPSPSSGQQKTKQELSSISAPLSHTHMLKKLKSFLTQSPHLLPSNTIHVLFWAQKLIVLYKHNLFKHGNKAAKHLRGYMQLSSAQKDHQGEKTGVTVQGCPYVPVPTALGRRLQPG